ncbi:MAG: hypothetical protein CTY20_08690 [Hyphomicrobium sp.]|nr:MAG: hypothetical protein CTY20_08690 [Hyphomicrobium sp.]
MGFPSDVIFIDKQVLLNTYADLGIKGLDVYASRSAAVFVSTELRAELRQAVGGTTTFTAIEGWLDRLFSAGRTVTVDPITADDRLLYNPSGKNNSIGGEQFDISVRKYMDLSPAGLRFEIVSEDVGLLSNQHLGQPIVNVNFKPTTLEAEMLDRVRDNLLSLDEFQTVSSRSYANVPGFQASQGFPSLEQYRQVRSDNLLGSLSGIPSGTRGIVRSLALFGAIDIAYSFVASTAEATEAVERNPNDIAGAYSPYVRWAAESFVGVPALVAGAFAANGDIWKTLALASLATEYSGGIASAVFRNSANGNTAATAGMTPEAFTARAQDILNSTLKFSTTVSEPITLIDGEEARNVSVYRVSDGALVYAAEIIEPEDQYYGPQVTVQYGGSIDGLFSSSISSISLASNDDSSTATTVRNDGTSQQVTMLNGDRAGEVIVLEKDAAGNLVAEGTRLDSGATVSRSRDPRSDPDAAGSWTTTVDYNSGPLLGGEIGSIFGSSLGQSLGGSNPFARIATSSVLGTLLDNVGETFGDVVANGTTLVDAANSAFHNFSAGLGSQIRSAGIGAISAFLTAELTEELGIDTTNFGGALFSYASNTAMGGVANDNAPWTEVRDAA